MKKSELKKSLNRILFTLNLVRVDGFENLNRMVGVGQELNRLLTELQGGPVEEDGEVDKNDACA